jgi:hypothetical protein
MYQQGTDKDYSGKMRYSTAYPMVAKYIEKAGGEGQELSFVTG